MRAEWWVILFKILVVAGVLVFFVFLGATIHYDSISPTVADKATGHVYPSYDKVHGRYVYLDRSALDFEHRMAWAAGGLVLSSILVGIKIEAPTSK